MNKSDLIDAVAGDADISKASAGRAVDAVLAAREGRNPQTGASMHIAASKVPGFKAGKGLKDKVKAG
jgi:DNA-binding protein HU-beta